MPTPPPYLEPGTAAYSRANLALFLAGFVTFSTLYTVQPLLPEITRAYGVTPATGSLALSMATFALAWALPASGTLSDAFGRRRMMGTAVVLSAILAILTALPLSLPALLTLRLLQGVVLAGVPAVAMAYLGEEIAPRALGAAMGLYIAGNACGGMTGRLLTAILADHLPWNLAIGILGGLTLVCALLFVMLLPASRHFHRRPFAPSPLTTSLLGHLREPGLLCLYAIAFCCMGAFVTLYNYVTFRLLDPPYALSQGQVAWIFLAYAFGAFGSGIIGGLVERHGRSRVLYRSLLTMAVGALLTLLQPLALLSVGIVVFTIGFFGAHAVASASVGQRAMTAKAQASSLYLCAYYLGSSISGTGGGFCWSAGGWAAVIALVVTLIAAALLAVLRLHRLDPGNEHTLSQAPNSPAS